MRVSNEQIHEFVGRFGVSSLEMSSTSIRDYQNQYNIGSINSPHVINDKRTEMVSMELSRQDFDRLVHIEHELHRVLEQEDREQRVQREYPAVRDAYHQYQMLLQLMR